MLSVPTVPWATSTGTLSTAWWNASRHGPSPSRSWAASRVWARGSVAVTQRSTSPSPTSMRPAPSALNSALAASATSWRAGPSPVLRSSRSWSEPMLLRSAPTSMRSTISSSVLPMGFTSARSRQRCRLRAVPFASAALGLALAGGALGGGGAALGGGIRGLGTGGRGRCAGGGHARRGGGGGRGARGGRGRRGRRGRGGGRRGRAAGGAAGAGGAGPAGGDLVPGLLDLVGGLVGDLLDAGPEVARDAVHDLLDLWLVEQLAGAGGDLPLALPASLGAEDVADRATDDHSELAQLHLRPPSPGGDLACLLADVPLHLAPGRRRGRDHRTRRNGGRRGGLLAGPRPLAGLALGLDRGGSRRRDGGGLAGRLARGPAAALGGGQPTGDGGRGAGGGGLRGLAAALGRSLPGLGGRAGGGAGGLAAGPSGGRGGGQAGGGRDLSGLAAGVGRPATGAIGLAGGPAGGPPAALGRLAGALAAGGGHCLAADLVGRLGEGVGGLPARLADPLADARRLPAAAAQRGQPGRDRGQDDRPEPGGGRLLAPAPPVGVPGGRAGGPARPGGPGGRRRRLARARGDPGHRRRVGLEPGGGRQLAGGVGRGRGAALGRGGLAGGQAAGRLLGGVLDAVVGVEAGLVLLGQLRVLLQPGSLADHRGLVGDLDGVAPLGGVGQRHERARAAEQARVHQGPLRLPARPVHIDGLDPAHRLVVGGYEGQAPPGAGLVDRW